ncbi:MAG TPA: hypothetical protein VGI95_02665 [Caulobacteraceae bacterium]
MASLIGKLQHPPPEQARNVRKQAEQIRYCVIQAKEYFDAALAVSLATKPVLLYYGVMSLALAEILFKQDGSSSLDYARGQHAHHGLDLRLGSNPSRKETLEESGSSLRAVPLIRGAKRSGTFELWHRSAREAPICGYRDTVLHQGARHKMPTVVGVPLDARMGTIEEGGRTFLDCVQAIPGMAPFLAQNGVRSTCARASLTNSYNEITSELSSELIIQPNHSDLLEGIYSKIAFDAKCVDKIRIRELPSGCVLNWGGKVGEADVPGRFPNSVQDSASFFYFQDNISELNEFGLFYLGLFMLGNYSRYFPDQWMVDVESSSALALAAMEFLSLAEERVPLLSLSEFSRLWYVFDK